MKIGIFVQNLTPDAGGGFTFQETVLGLLKEKTENFEFTIFHYGEVPTQLQALPVNFVGIGSRGFITKVKKFHFALQRKLQKYFRRISQGLGVKLPYPASSALDKASRGRVDVMLFLTPFTEWVEVPYICTVWDLEHRAQPFFPEVSENHEWDAREKTYQQLLRRASYIITGTEVGKFEVSHYYGVDPQRIRLLPHPTPSFALKSGSAEKAIPLPGPFIFYPAQFWAHKNHYHLVEAMRHLPENLQLVFVGSDKGNRAHIQDLVKKLGLEKRVHFLGFISREELVWLYRNADCLVYPSLCGPENLPPLEAFALGCPVVANRIPGSVEQLGDCAVLCDAKDPKSIAEAVIGLRQDSALKNLLIEKSRRRALKYTEKEFVHDLFKIFSEFEKVRVLWP